MKQLLADLNLKNFNEYYNAILESYEKGEEEKARVLFNRLSRPYRKEFLSYTIVQKDGITNEVKEFFISLIY